MDVQVVRIDTHVWNCLRRCVTVVVVIVDVIVVFVVFVVVIFVVCKVLSNIC